ncbi:MAG TPA: hypothetical protein VJ775_05945 [Sphingomicrobium sp.]|nr:hypothetical protein [Sphingomicrobium sp.]
MPFDINFGALQYANPFKAFSEGQEIGAQNRQRQARQAAGNVFASDPDRAAQIMLEAGDWEGGLTARKYAKEDRQEKARAAAATKYASGDSKGAQADALAVGEVDLAKSIASLDESARKAVKERNDIFGASLYHIGKMPYEQRRTEIQQLKPGLIQQGFTAEQIDAFDPTDQNVGALLNQSLGVKELLVAADRETDNARADRQAGETARHNRASEATSRGQLGVAQSNASRGWAAHNARLKAGGYGTPGVGGGVVPDNDVEID